MNKLAFALVDKLPAYDGLQTEDGTYQGVNGKYFPFSIYV